VLLVVQAQRHDFGGQAGRQQANILQAVGIFGRLDFAEWLAFDSLNRLALQYPVFGFSFNSEAYYFHSASLAVSGVVLQVCDFIAQISLIVLYFNFYEN